MFCRAAPGVRALPPQASVVRQTQFIPRFDHAPHTRTVRPEPESKQKANRKQTWESSLYWRVGCTALAYSGLKSVAASRSEDPSLDGNRLLASLRYRADRKQSATSTAPSATAASGAAASDAPVQRGVPSPTAIQNTLTASSISLRGLWRLAVENPKRTAGIGMKMQRECASIRESANHGIAAQKVSPTRMGKSCHPRQRRAPESVLMPRNPKFARILLPQNSADTLCVLDVVKYRKLKRV
ncbi:hypothetical protein bAD24_III10440 [Burkholderia sp. AD24]|nr:hypothetical protein bAD24_III10440 [Burkholderia sp. AD24]